MSDPPHASSWAAPPEFYFDENAVTRVVRKVLVRLGYVCHTPPEVFGTRADSEGATDTEWLTKVRGSGWAVLNRDAKIMERPDELQAYRAAKVHMFYLPGEATRDQLRDLVEEHLGLIVTYATGRTPQIWRVTARGIDPFRPRAPRRR